MSRSIYNMTTDFLIEPVLTHQIPAVPLPNKEVYQSRSVNQKIFDYINGVSFQIGTQGAIFSLLFMTIDRVLALKKPYWQQKITTRFMIGLILGLWAVIVTTLVLILLSAKFIFQPYHSYLKYFFSFRIYQN